MRFNNQYKTIYNVKKNSKEKPSQTRGSKYIYCGSVFTITQKTNENTETHKQ